MTISWDGAPSRKSLVPVDGVLHESFSFSVTPPSGLGNSLAPRGDGQQRLLRRVADSRQRRGPPTVCEKAELSRIGGRPGTTLGRCREARGLTPIYHTKWALSSLLVQ